MNRQDFEDKMEMILPGDKIRLVIRGNYEDKVEEGIFVKVDRDGFVYLNEGFAHSYRRIKRIHFIERIKRG